MKYTARLISLEEFEASEPCMSPWNLMETDMFEDYDPMFTESIPNNVKLSLRDLHWLWRNGIVPDKDVMWCFWNLPVLEEFPLSGWLAEPISIFARDCPIDGFNNMIYSNYSRALHYLWKHGGGTLADIQHNFVCLTWNWIFHNVEQPPPALDWTDYKVED